MNRVVSFVLLFIAINQAYPQNLIINPGFETWQKINKPTGWTTALGCLKDSVIIYSGTYSCRQAATSESRELGQVVSVIPGNPYRITIWYRNDPAGSGNGCRIWSNWKDADGNSITDDISLPLLHSAYLKSETWKQYSAEVIAPSNAAFFNLVLRTLPNSITYWDDIVFEESVTTGKSDIGSNNIKIYPNPACNYLIISNIQNIQRIDIQTITGIRIWSGDIISDESVTIPVSEFKEGIYIISMYGIRMKLVKKFVKSGK